MTFQLESTWDVILVIALIVAIAPWFGAYLGKVYMDRPLFGDFLLNPIERTVYRILGTSPRKQMRPGEYMLALLLFNGAVFAFLYLYFFFQSGLPLDATGAPNMTWDLAFHSAASFTTNTDFTHFTNESQMSMGSEMIAWELALFTSAATGLAVFAAMVRGFVRRDGTLGNFYVDLTRSLTRVLIPLATAFALIFVLFGVPETLRNYLDVTQLGGGMQTIYLGPVASFQSISLLGSNGGGWYSANAAYPLANPSAASNLFMTGVMMLIPFSTPFAFQQIVRKRGEAWPFMGTILIIFVVALGLFIAYQAATNPALLSISNLGLSNNGYPVGSETRFSLPENSLFQVASVYDNVGANNLSIGSVAPVAQLVLLFGMFTQSTPGGVGCGFGTLLLFAVLAIFVGGLMVGRTPEYLGKKIGTVEVKWAGLALLVHPAIILIPFSVGVLVGAPGIQGAVVGATAHNFTSVLYELTSEAANNGSALSSASFNDSTTFWNVTGAIVMLVGRFVPFWAMLQVGGLFAQQETMPPGPGTLKTASWTFTIYLTMILIIISALLFLPVMALGPLAQIL